MAFFFLGFLSFHIYPTSVAILIHILFIMRCFFAPARFLSGVKEKIAGRYDETRNKTTAVAVTDSVSCEVENV